jgi:hypothetical protein
MKVRPGMRLSMAVPSVAELKLIPAYPNICANQLNKHSKSSKIKTKQSNKDSIKQNQNKLKSHTQIDQARRIHRE